MVERSRTWRRSFLTWTSIAILIGGVVLAAIAGALRDPGARETPPVPTAVPFDDQLPAIAPPPPREWLDPWMASADFADVLEAIPELAEDPLAASDLVRSIERSLDGEHEELASLLASADDPEALAALAALASEDRPYANLALGLALPPTEIGAAAFEREARVTNSDRARHHALETWLLLGRERELARLRRDPAYEAEFDARLRYVRAVHRLDWVDLWLYTGPSQIGRAPATFIALGVLSGLVWLAFLAYAGGVRSLLSSRFALCAAAVVLGVLSVVPTLVLNVWMEQVLGIHESDSLIGGVAYFVVSVGLREETCKLLAFLPLAPIVIRRKDPLEMLIVAGCVGLGFAAEENVGYFAQSSGGDAAGRFLTANFGHVVDTGLVGFAFCRMVLEPKRYAGEFALVFVLIVVGHGVYDALIIVPALADWQMASGMIYVLVAFVFFGELKDYARAIKHRVPLTAVFVYGLAIVLAATLIGSSWEVGFTPALTVIVPSTLAAGLFVFVFFRQIDEPLLP